MSRQEWMSAHQRQDWLHFKGATLLLSAGVGRQAETQAEILNLVP